MHIDQSRKHQRRFWLLLSGAVALGLGSGLILARFFFGTSAEPIPAHSRIRDTVPVLEATTREVHLYFAGSNGGHLHAEERRIHAADTLCAAESIVTALLKGPKSPNLISPFPSASRLRNLFVTDNGTAYVDCTAELCRLHPGGVTAERLTLYAIVNSLVLNLEEVDRVQILLEGKPAATLAGHLDIRRTKTANLLIIR
ncbi:MAG: GerMN domain-containing protein [Syntrophobacteria bacterium]